MRKTFVVRLVGVLIGGGLAVAAGWAAVSATPDLSVHEDEQTVSGESTGAVAPTPEAWREVERLIEDDRYEAAAARAGELRQAAQAAGDVEGWTRGLLLEARLRIGLHGYETAVRELREKPWPETPLQRSILDLYYGEALVSYARAYSWEIRQRERVASDDTVDLRAWTLEQIAGAAQAAYLAAWRQRASWGSEPLGDFGEYIDPNDFPARIRGTLRDAVTYLFVELLADESLWGPRQSQEVYRLPLARLAEGDAAGLADIDLAAPAVHPLEKIAAALDDLEAWHRDAGRREAAFEARRERLRRLRASLTREEDREELRRALAAATEALGPGHGWWAMGMATLAEWTREEPDPQARVRAHALAEECVATHADSLGGKRCRRLLADVEAPRYRLEGMASDGAGKASLRVHHRNLEHLYLRAYAVDLERRIATARDYELLPGYNEVPRLLRRQPAAEWSVALPPTPDFRMHATDVTPPLETPGLYVVVASARRDFARRGNDRQAVNFLLTDLVLATRMEGDAVEVTALSGSSGRPLPGVAVGLYRYDWQQGHREAARRETDEHGESRFRLPRREVHFLFARHGEHVAINLDSLYPHGGERGPQARRALVYTDRSVYRPRQKILWKVVLYGGTPREGRLRVEAGATARVELVDANGEVVAGEEVTANDHGSASGEFEIPAGRLLGRWQLRTDAGGSAAVRVEEYKRPTFEVTVDEPAEALRLNRAAELRGEARYYFGLPVTAGRVAWRVNREPVYPPWWWWFGSPRESPRVVAAGASALDADGRFTVAFTPEVDEREADSGVTYRYRLSVDVTDEGGETRSAERVFRLGFVAVEARLEDEPGFLLAETAVALTLRRTDLDGAPRPGAGSWELLRLAEPAETPLPADQPPPPPAAETADAYRTPGDLRRPRWNTAYTPQAMLRRWDDGEAVASGALEHDEAGRATVELPGLPAGAYRLRYRTSDPFGAEYELTHELVVAADGADAPALPALLAVAEESVPVGGTARLLVASGLADQPLTVDILRYGEVVERRRLSSGDGIQVLEIAVGREHRGGFGVTLSAIRDHQPMRLAARVAVPWDDRRLEVVLASFRDRLRPKERETWSVTVRGAEGAALEEGAAELLAYMYDRSLDLFAPHTPPDALRLYPDATATGYATTTLGAAEATWRDVRDFVRLPRAPRLTGDSLRWLSGYGIGGVARRHQAETVAFLESAPAPPAPRAPGMADGDAVAEEIVAPPTDAIAKSTAGAREEPPIAADALRTDFSETAFWRPHLLLGPDGSATVEFTVPDSVTEWSFWVHALTRDLRGGSLESRTRTVKELLVRPYLPRFLREGDRAELRVAVDNAGERPLAGTVRLELLDPESEESLLTDFGLTAEAAEAAFEAAPGAGTTVTFPLTAPSRVGPAVVRVTAAAEDLADGEQRALPVLPGRVHLAQSRFAALHDAGSRTLRFDDLAADDDPTRIDDQMVVTIDGQLFYTVLSALPYLVSFPYECTEQTLNRFVSTGIVSGVFARHPAVARMAEEMAQRDSRFESWNPDDPNRKLALEETPWLALSRGGRDGEEELVRLLDPQVAAAERDATIARLQQAQTSLGAFPWFPGGSPSPYMTLYILYGLSQALEHDVSVPQEMVVRAWDYMHRHYLDELVRLMRRDDCCFELVTFLSYVLSAYPDESWTGGVFTAAERRRMLDFSFRHWREHAPLSKAQLALTLHRAGRGDDAWTVFASILDSAQSDEDLGVYWAPEERAWLWYNDSIDTHAFVLQALLELAPDDERRHGLVQWLLLNKKLNHWKSTRATAEVIYALVAYLEREGALGVREEARVVAGPVTETFVFEPDRFTGKGNQVVVAGEEVTPAMAEVTVSKETPGILFASATWHFSTERLPEASSGDLLAVERRYFRRLADGDGFRLEPLVEGAEVAVGDQVEVHLSLRARHSAEHVHLQDPRAAGFEPETVASRHRRDLGLAWYEEVRDSATNFFFERLPAGEYTLKYRLRASMAGTFRVGPATLQSMYAPEFTAYSSGARLELLP